LITVRLGLKAILKKKLSSLIRKPKILARFLLAYQEDEDVQAFIKHNNFGFLIALLIPTGANVLLPKVDNEHKGFWLLSEAFNTLSVGSDSSNF
jgi:hypothetical protein